MATFNIVTSCDDNYAQHACVTLTSLLSHHPNASQIFRIFILVPSCFSQANRAKIVDSLNPWMPELEFVYIDKSAVPRLKTGGHVNLVTYYKLYAPDLLPYDIKTALCLDSDIIINRCILDLLDTDISNYSLAAVPDPQADKDERIRSKLCLKQNAHYFNNGVLLLNLERWRSEKICSRAVEFCMSNPDLITWHDQCALNHIVQGNFYVLDKKWNFQFAHLQRISECKFKQNSIREASSAAIIHFNGGASKPWSYLCTHPMKDLYGKYLKYTTWRDFTETDRTRRNIVKKYLRIRSPFNIPSS